MREESNLGGPRYSVGASASNINSTQCEKRAEQTVGNMIDAKLASLALDIHRVMELKFRTHQIRDVPVSVIRELAAL